MSILWMALCAHSVNGIDMAKVSLTAAAMWPTASFPLGDFRNELEDFTGLATQIQAAQARCGTAAVQWVVEPTGGYAP